MVKLNELSDNAGANKRRMRVGRGVGSGKGKTAGRGVKGQKSRSGVAVNGFEGGQMPLYRRLPKRGFNNAEFARRHAIVNLGRLQQAIDGGRVDPSQPVDAAVLRNAGLLRAGETTYRLLAKGTFSSKVAISATGASAGAVKAVEAAGGSVQVTDPTPGADAGEQTG